MAKHDFHEKAFDEGTILKLEILSRYLEEWLPVFTHTPNMARINIFDFQCGPGQDIQGVKGSPLRITDVIAAARPSTKMASPRIVVHFNDIEIAKIDQLRGLLQGCETGCEYDFSSLEFEDCFNKCLPGMHKPGTANFLFIDPTGLIKMDSIVSQLSKLKLTDFLLFVPVQYVRRFAGKAEFQRYMPGMKCNGNFEDTPSEVCAYIQEKLNASGSSYFLAHFSIRKANSANVHSLVFGSRSPKGLEKFLRVVWNMSPNGETNFELSGDLLFKTKQLKLPGIKEISSKQQLFQEELEAKVLSGELGTARAVALFSLRRAFLPTRHAKPVLSDLKKRGLLQNVPPLGYDKVFGGEEIPLVRSASTGDNCGRAK
ncbi:MAG: hypothetical protein CVU73_10660 [Deltaproteobacteria bacterium HGW-Deltaproteobacteria-8]|jgi:three-Cys-motif partner protein|nr:MAG: hypothetical protein CVU73_10660 [Deltaproteobacteria bacterium HGW-Deltaproteobacteria-8]